MLTLISDIDRVCFVPRSSVIDNGLVGKSKIGSSTIALSEYTDGEEHALNVQLKKGKKEKDAGVLAITIQLLQPAKLSRA